MLTEISIPEIDDFFTEYRPVHNWHYVYDRVLIVLYEMQVSDYRELLEGFD
jgi:hypothetical protein